MATAQLLEDFASLLRPVTLNNPRLNVVPLLPFASWSAGNTGDAEHSCSTHVLGFNSCEKPQRGMHVRADHVANIPDLHSVLISSKHSAEAAPLLERLNASRAPHLPRLRALSLPGEGSQANTASRKAA